MLTGKSYLEYLNYIARSEIYLIGTWDLGLGRKKSFHAVFMSNPLPKEINVIILFVITPITLPISACNKSFESLGRSLSGRGIG